VRKLVLMGLYVNRDGEVEWFGRYVRDATAAVVPESLRRAYEERSPDGAEHFDVVAEKILHLWRTEPDLPIDALRELSVPTLLLQGDADIVTLEHVVLLFRLLGGGGMGLPGAMPRSRLAIFPSTSHTDVAERPELVLAIVPPFLDD